MTQEQLEHKIRSLLRKAEATDFEHEADAFIAKAQELINRYAIDEEELWANEPEKKVGIETRVIRIEDRKVGSHEKRQILNSIAMSNRCRMWYNEGMSTSRIAGFPTDLLFVEMLYTSVITQMEFKMVMEQAFSDDNPKTFISNFMIAYANTIAKRFAAITRKNVETITNSQEIALRDRSQEVAVWVEQNLNLRSARAKADPNYSHKARTAGEKAAYETDISGGRNSLEERNWNVR